MDGDKDWVSDALRGVPEGSRHITAVRLVGLWYAKGYSKEQVETLLKSWNQRNRPPLDDRELKSILNSTDRWELSREKIEKWEPLVEALSDLGRVIKKGSEPPYHQIATVVQVLCCFRTLRDTGEVLVYQRGLYVPAEPLVAEHVEDLLQAIHRGNKATVHCVKEVIGHIQRSTYVDRQDFDSDPDLVNLNNGILNLKTGQLKPHSKEFLSTIRVPVIYDPKADCPLIKNFLSEIVPAQSVPLMEEIFGWCLDRSLISMRRLVLLLGEGANGKTTLTELLRTFLGETNCSAAPLHSLASNRFAAATLYGKLANICAELSATDIKETSRLKALTGGDTIQAEHKFGKPFSFKNKAKLIFAANQLPRIDDDTYATWSRLVPVKFPYRFTGDKADQRLLSKLTTPEELSGLLNLAIKAVAKLRQRGDFSYAPSPDVVRERYTLQSDPIQAFVEEACVFDPFCWISKQDLYKGFQEFCQKKSIPLLGIRSLGRQINKRKLATHMQQDGQHGWQGLKLI